VNDIDRSSSSNDWLAIARRTGVEALACVAGALAVTYLLMTLFDAAPLRAAMVSSAVAALVIAGAFSVLLGLKRQELARLRSRLNQTNSVDSLTLCLDGSVFSALVDSYQTHAGEAGVGRRGAFLIVDADHFKSINERFGHAWGDEALRVISAAIKACLRSGDLVGRLGGEEFGVFLPGASEPNATRVAERIRSVISETLFEPGGRQCDLSVTVGAVVFESQLAFDDLFRAADSVLSTAKREGRNQTRIEHLSEVGRNADSPSPPAYK
jgi:diguanylate cyclase